MTYTVIKSNNKAWLKEDAVMLSPEEEGNYFTDNQLREGWNKYYEHIAALKEIPIAPEYVDYWSEGAKVEEGEFTTKRGKQINTTDQQQWQEMSISEKDAYFEKIAIPAQKDEAGLSIDDLKRLRNYFGEHDKTAFEHWAYSILNKEIKRKQ